MKNLRKFSANSCEKKICQHNNLESASNNSDVSSIEITNTINTVTKALKELNKGITGKEAYQMATEANLNHYKNRDINYVQVGDTVTYDRKTENITISSKNSNYTENIDNKNTDNADNQSKKSSQAETKENMSFEEKKTSAIKYFKGKGYTLAQACGMLGNLLQESSTLKHDAVGDNGKAYGICQWHRPRQKDFKEAFNKNIKDSNFIDQIAFIVYELQNNETTANNKLKRANTPEQAAEFFDRYYERSNGKSRGKRKTNARNLYNKYQYLA